MTRFFSGLILGWGIAPWQHASWIYLSCASKPKAKASTYTMKNGYQVHWGSIFKRNLADTEKSVFLIFIFLAKYPPSQGLGVDSKFWSPAKDGIYSAASFFMTIFLDVPGLLVTSIIFGNQGLLLGCFDFCWLALHEQFLPWIISTVAS